MALNIEDVLGLFEGDKIDRIKSVAARRQQLVAEIAKLNAELTETEAELHRLITGAPAEAPKSKRHCKLCGAAGHIVARKKTADGRETCASYPNGKPLQYAA